MGQMNDSPSDRVRELLVRLDRVATYSRGHRAGLHVYDEALMRQYLQILMEWEGDALGLDTSSSIRKVPPYSRRPLA